MLNELPNQGTKQMATAKKAMVSSSHPAVTRVMVDVLQDGGNAVDAAITGCLLQPVHEPHQTNHAGTVVFLYWDVDTQRTYFMDASAELPLGLKPFCPNLRAPEKAACIPGFIPGLSSMAEKFGTKPWSYYVQPAIKAAEEGSYVTSWEYGYLRRPQTLGTYTYFQSGRGFFTPSGFLRPVGHRWKMPRLAKTLHRLAEEGCEYFTKGDWAKHLIQEGKKLGWQITLEHLASYEPLWMNPLSFTYRDDEIVGNPPPQRGGIYTGFILGVLEEFDLRRMGHYTESAETLALMAWVLSRAHVEKGLIHDPQYYDVPTEVLLSKDYHRLIAQLWRKSRPKIDLTDFLRLTVDRTALIAGLPSFPQIPHDSCELSIVDQYGNWVEMMNTGNGGGLPGMVIDGVVNHGTTIRTSEAIIGTGRFGWIVEPGARTRHAIANTLVLRDGTPWLAMGSPGDCIFTVPQVLLNILEFRLDPYSAADAPRFYPLGDDGTLEVENRIPESVISALLQRGILVRPLGTYGWMGSMQIVWYDKISGGYGGVADPRRLGKAQGF
jgi:gamma-glutamyltranspeptidase/glutathione hydrolase